MPWRDKPADEVIWMRPKNWDRFQHYKDGRNTYWIKNWINLDDPSSKFKKLTWADQGRLQALWRLAAKLERDGMIPYDEKYLRAALGDKRFPIASQMLPIWFHIGTQKALKTAAKREKRSRDLVQDGTKEVRSKRKKPLTPSGDLQKLELVTTCPECFCGAGLHTADCSVRAA